MTFFFVSVMLITMEILTVEEESLILFIMSMIYQLIEDPMLSTVENDQILRPSWLLHQKQ